jgi:hypothetical protein
MTARSTFESSLKNAGPTCVQSLTNASAAAIASINAVGVDIGSNPMLGVTSGHDASIRAANTALQVAQQASQVAKQATEDAAKATLRNTGDLAPF